MASLLLTSTLSGSAQIITNNSKAGSDSLILEYLGKRPHALDNIDCSSSRLTVLNIIDSMIENAGTNYEKVSTYRLRLDISMRTVSDTLFACTTDAYLIRPLEKMKMHLLVVPPDNAYLIHVNRLTRNQSLRMLPVDGYPKMSIEDCLSGLREQASKNDAYFFRRQEYEDTTLVIIIKNRKAPSSLFARIDNNSNLPEACSFRIVTVDRKNWALVNSYSSVIETTEKEHSAFIAASYYEQLLQILTPIISDKNRKHFSSIDKLLKGDKGYRVDDILFENNLYLVSRNLVTGTTNDEASIYYYWMHNFTEELISPKGYKLFKVKDMLRATAATPN